MDDKEKESLLQGLEKLKRLSLSATQGVARPDYFNKETNYLTEVEKRCSVEMLEVKLAEAQNKLKYRKILPVLLIQLGLIWIFFIFAILLLQGFGHWLGFAFHLENSVLHTLLITTTAQVFGLIVIIIKYFFK